MPAAGRGCHPTSCAGAQQCIRDRKDYESVGPPPPPGWPVSCCLGNPALHLAASRPAVERVARRLDDPVHAAGPLPSAYLDRETAHPGGAPLCGPAAPDPPVRIRV